MTRVLAIALSTLAAIQGLFIVAAGYVIAALPDVSMEPGNVLADLVVTAILFGMIAGTGALIAWMNVE